MPRYQTVPVTTKNLRLFIEYCRLYGKDHDESYLPDDGFVLSPDQPSYLMMSENRVSGAVSLMRSESYLEAKNARFAIFHAQTASLEDYRTLYQAIAPHFEGLDQVYLFIPDDMSDLKAILHMLGFRPERTAYLLCLDEPEEQVIDLPDRYRVQSVAQDDTKAQAALRQVINQNLNLEADQPQLTLEEVAGWFMSKTYLQNGIALLYANQEPAGGICIFCDEEKKSEAFVAYVCVNKDHRGKGLGRKLLRWSINLARSNQLKPVYLSVRAENDTAIRLYLSEGFRLVDSRACYRRKIIRKKRL